MFQTHCYDSWLSPAARKSAFFMWSQLLGTLPAPLFLFLAGISFALMTRKLEQRGGRANRVALTTMRRGTEIFGLGLLFRLQEYLIAFPWAPATDLLRVDILNIIGVSIVLMGAVCWGCRVLFGAKAEDDGRAPVSDWILAAAAIVVSLAISLVTPLMWTVWRPNWLAWPFESYFDGVHNLGQPQAWLFPVFPWAGFAFAGLALGVVLLSGWGRRHVVLTHLLAAGLGALLIAVARWLDEGKQIYPVYDFWHTSPNFFLIRVGILLAILFASYVWCRWGAGGWGFSPLIQLGQTSLLVYWVHIEFVYGRFSILKKHEMTVFGASIGLLIIFLFMLLLSMMRTRLKGRAIWSSVRMPAHGRIQRTGRPSPRLSWRAGKEARCLSRSWVRKVPGIARLPDFCRLIPVHGGIMPKAFIPIVLGCCWLAEAQTLSPEVRNFVKIDAPVVALTHVRVIDGTGAAEREDQTVILSQGKIESVGDASAANVPQKAQALDLHGYSLIPGLVGMHDHMFYPVGPGSFGEMAYSFPRLYLAGGVTTIRTTGSLEPYTDLEIRRAIESGKMPGPKVHVTGPYLEGAGSWALQLHQLAGPEDATRTVNYWLDEGVDDFKAYMFITHDELGAAINAAHKRGAKVTGHLCTVGFREAAALGIDDLEHGLMVDSEFLPDKKPGQCKDEEDPVEMAKLDVNSGPVHEMILDLVARHVAVTSTLPVFEMGSFAGRPTLQTRVLDALSPDARALLLERRVRSGDGAAIRKRYGTETSPWPAAFKKEMEFEYVFSKAGGLLLAGLDPTGMGGVLAGFGDQREVELLVEAGFTPLEAIHIATFNGAQYLGELDRIGTIAPGKQADLVVIKGDPAKKIEDMENVETVFKDGIGYDSSKLIESVHGLVGIR